MFTASITAALIVTLIAFIILNQSHKKTNEKFRLMLDKFNKQAHTLDTMSIEKDILEETNARLKGSLHAANREVTQQQAVINQLRSLRRYTGSIMKSSIDLIHDEMKRHHRNQSADLVLMLHEVNLDELSVEEALKERGRMESGGIHIKVAAE